jgi:hypothetical protein
MKNIRHLVCLSILNFLTISQNYSMYSTNEQALKNRDLDENSPEIIAATSLLSLKNYYDNEIYKQPKQKLKINAKAKNFITYFQKGKYAEIKSVLNNPQERKKLLILSNNQKLLQLLCYIAAQKKQSNKDYEDIYAKTISVLLHDQEIRKLIAPQITRLFQKIISMGNVLRLRSLLKYKDLVAQFNVTNIRAAIVFVAGRGQNTILKTLLDNEKICASIDQTTAINALKNAGSGQKDKVRNSVICTLLENDTVYNFLEKFNLAEYLSEKSLNYIYSYTEKDKVRNLIKNSFF